MSETSPRIDPDLLLEASRVFNAAGNEYQKIAAVVSDLAVQYVGTRRGALEAAILCDAAALRLSKRVPGGYDKALELLSSVDPAQSEDKGGRLFFLRALANGQKYNTLQAGQGTTSDVATALAALIAADLAEAFARSPGLFGLVQHYFTPHSSLPADDENDLQLAYAQQPAVKKVIEEQAAKNKRPAPSQPAPEPAPLASAPAQPPPRTSG